MSGYPKNSGSSEPQNQDMEVIDILKRMQQQLVYLEKKIDTLIAQRPNQESRPPFQRNFSRPFRPYGRPNPGSGQEADRAGAGVYRGHSKGGFPPKKPFYKKRDQ